MIRIVAQEPDFLIVVVFMPTSTRRRASTGDMIFENTSLGTSHKATSVMNFNKQTGATHTVCWSQLFVIELKQVFSSFLVTKEKQ